MEREAPGITTSPRTGELPRLLRLVAARQATVLNVADLARDAQLPEHSRITLSGPFLPDRTVHLRHVDWRVAGACARTRMTAKADPRKKQ